MQDIRDKMATVRTQEEFNKLAEELNSTSQSKKEYTRQQQLKEDKKLIQDKMDVAKEEAKIAKELEKKKLDEYKVQQEKKVEEAKSSEKEITQNLKEELDERESMFKNSLLAMISTLEGNLPKFAVLGKKMARSLAGENVNLSSVASNLSSVSSGVTNNSTSNTSYSTNNNVNMTNIVRNGVDLNNIKNMMKTVLQNENRAKGKV